MQLIHGRAEGLGQHGVNDLHLLTADGEAKVPHHPALRRPHVAGRQDVDEQMVDERLGSGQLEFRQVAVDLGEVANLAIRPLDLHGVNGVQPFDAARWPDDLERGLQHSLVDRQHVLNAKLQGRPAVGDQGPEARHRWHLHQAQQDVRAGGRLQHGARSAGGPGCAPASGQGRLHFALLQSAVVQPMFVKLPAAAQVRHGNGAGFKQVHGGDSPWFVTSTSFRRGHLLGFRYRACPIHPRSCAGRLPPKWVRHRVGWPPAPAARCAGCGPGIPGSSGRAPPAAPHRGRRLRCPPC